MTSKATVGQAIDQILAALEALDKRQQQTVVSTVCQLLDIGQPSVRSEGRASVADTHPTHSAQPVAPPPKAPEVSASERRLDIRSLKAQKQPESASQMACVVAFYLMEHADAPNGDAVVTNADLDKYFKQAGFPLPKKLEQVLPDGKRAGYFEQVNRGEYKLTRVGYNLVAHSLPKSAKAA